MAGFVGTPFALVVLAAAMWPERFPFVLPFGYVMLFLMPTMMLAIILIYYLLERRKRCSVTMEGIEFWTPWRGPRRFTWDEVASVDLARYTVRLHTMTRSYPPPSLAFIDREAISPHIPEEKRRFISQL